MDQTKRGINPIKMNTSKLEYKYEKKFSIMQHREARDEKCKRAPSHSSQTRNKRNPNWNKRSKTVTVCRQLDTIYRKS